jgi:carboxyl-terminal processing protease
MTKSKAFLLAAVVAIAGFALLGGRSDGDRFYSDLARLDRIVTKIKESYVEEVSSRELLDAAVEGMRDVLDPHTAYFEASDYADLKASTDGEFGGLGIQIGMRDRALTVIAPMAGTPAQRLGLRAGDRILRIDTLDTRGIEVDDAVDRLRGKPGTKVTLRIAREGVADPLDFTITRAIIKVESVPYAGMLDDSTGYVKVTQFSRNTAEDLENAVVALRDSGAKGLVLDLRMNPGGLLDQAVGVSELFLGEGRTVVSTRGRVRSQNQEYLSEREPVFNGRLAVLVNGGSASASEIVAGAVQDWDRGVLLGSNTFGKGSVQTVLPIDGKDNALKLTTAYYYTPSGRNINRPENGRRGRLIAAAEEEDDDSEALPEDGKADSKTGAAKKSAKAGKADSVVFKTLSGRVVRQSGGITPDVEVADRRYPRFELELFRRGMFFGFVVKRLADPAARAAVTPSFEVSPALLEDFRAFVFADSAFSRYRGAGAAALDQVRAAWARERLDRGEDTTGASAAEFRKAYAALEAEMRAEAAREFEANRAVIRRELKAEFLGAALGERARATFELKDDPQVTEARRRLGDAKAYAAALKPQSGSKKAGQ